MLFTGVAIVLEGSKFKVDVSIDTRHTGNVLTKNWVYNDLIKWNEQSGYCWVNKYGN